MKFKAAILEKQNSPLVVDEIESPELSIGQVLVQVHAAGICGAQLGEISGAQGEDPYLPHLLGHEGGGVVVEVGPGVTHVNLDDHVVMHWRRGTGIEAKPPKYKHGEELVGGGPVTTFNEYAVVSENRLTAIHKDVPFEIAALMGCSVTTGLGLINNEAKLKIGESIAVAGCGGVGLSVIQGARMVSASSIIAIDIKPEKLDMAIALGASFGDENINELDDRVDVFVDCTGSPRVIKAGLEMLAPGGRMILVGQPRWDESLMITDFRQHYCGKTIIDSQGGLTNPSIDIPRYLELFLNGPLDLHCLIGKRFSLEKVNDAIKAMQKGQAGRCILEMNQP